MPPPPIQGIGNDAGFTMQVELRDGSFDMAKLQSVTNAIVANAKTQSALQLVLASFRSSVPQYRLEVDRVKTEALQVSLDQVFAALAGYLGSTYVNQFNQFGRVFQVYVQADSQSRVRLEDIENMFVRNRDGQMIRLVPS
jgi:hydrophobic/amphiphilic exporter-1 (mainly G- bacteria), HAE1 family